MPIWIVKATWIEDEADVSERWEVNAPTAHDAVREATTHIRFQPHHIEVRCSDQDGGVDLPPGQVRRLPPR